MRNVAKKINKQTNKTNHNDVCVLHSDELLSFIKGASLLRHAKPCGKKIDDS